MLICEDCQFKNTSECDLCMFISDTNATCYLKKEEYGLLDNKEENNE